MIQLKVYKQPNDNASSLFIDLYDTEPIKLTLSIEDITTADASSVYSKTFRVPGTRNNNEFFKNAFEIDGVDFDVTTKKAAEILVDGAEFKQGHIRLQQIFVNGEGDKIDYELLFLGETRDLASIIGDKRMCDLNLDDLTPTGTTYTMQDIEQSWLAYPQSASLTAGLHDGNILFPLVDHGALYDDDGAPLSGFNQIALGPANSGAFNHQNHPISAERFKPVIRAKRLVDEIFESAGYSYESEFFESELFHQLYISAFGNTARIGIEVEQSNDIVFQATSNTNQGSGILELNTVIQNPLNLFETYNGAVGGSIFTVPVGVTGGDTASYYVMNASCFWEGWLEDSDYTNDFIDATLQIYNYTTSQVLAQSTLSSGTLNCQWDSRNGNGVNAGDIIVIRVNPQGGTLDYEEVQDAYWECVAAPGGYYPSRDLDCDYKQIDFLKDILTSFRLVLQPKVGDPKTFIIEPWQEWIGSGRTYDWSHKLVNNKDFQIEPLFNTQSETIEFELEEDEDWINKFHQDDYKKVHGYLRFDSNNELLEGNRKIEVKYSPTPITQIEQFLNPQHVEPGFIIPFMHKHENDGPVTQHQPIKPNTRFLFYNGEQPIVDSDHYWYSVGSTPTNYDTWPLVSMYSEWPPTNDSVKLEWSNDIRYFLNGVGSQYQVLGSTLYTSYWSRYIESLYNKFSRRVTANFTLNNIDLQYFGFNDVIFVNGKYYRPEKIIDVEVGKTTEVKVQLITLKDQRPIWLPDPLTGFSVVTFNNGCAGEQGTIQVTTNGTPNFTWTLQEAGTSGTYNSIVGQAPYVFNVPAPVGTDTITVTDSLGRTATITVEVPANTATPITATMVKVNPTICADDEGQCNGSITVTPSGGVAPYTIVWSDGGAPNLNRTQLCEGVYNFDIFDANGCPAAQSFSIQLICEDGVEEWDVEQLNAECSTFGGLITIEAPDGQLQVGDVITLDEIDGCFRVHSPSQDQPQYTFDQEWQDCPECISQQTTSISWEIQNCLDDTVRYVTNQGSPSLNIGMVITITETNGCWEVIKETQIQPDSTLSQVYRDCESCGDTQSGFIYDVTACDFSFSGKASSTIDGLAVGTVMQLDDGSCVTINQQVPEGTPVYVLNDSETYIDCSSCESSVVRQVCHKILGEGNPGDLASGTYIFNSNTFNWVVKQGETIYICAEVGSVTLDVGLASISVSEFDCTSPSACLP